MTATQNDVVIALSSEELFAVFLTPLLPRIGQITPRNRAYHQSSEFGQTFSTSSFENEITAITLTMKLYIEIPITTRTDKNITVAPRLTKQLPFSFGEFALVEETGWVVV
tara:strand:+ start:1211 stop:1540 length:330 start_codon:yes stop_codon:yes gene_type:complete